jgi:SecD/SecF fusion protein
MRYKGLITSFTLIIAAISIYALSFTWVAWRVEQAATVEATDNKGNIDYEQRQAILDSKWKKEVHKVFGLVYTYEEVKQRELSMGLDLQGGTQVTLEIDRPAFLNKLAGANSRDVAFAKVLEKTKKAYAAQPAKDFFVHFYEIHAADRKGVPFSSLFPTLHDYIGAKAPAKTDKGTLKSLNKALANTARDTIPTLINRVNNTGVTGINMMLQPNNTILAVLPGSNNRSRLEQLLKKEGVLRFLEVASDKEAVIANFPKNLKAHLKAIKDKKHFNLVKKAIFLTSDGLKCDKKYAKGIAKLLRDPEVNMLLPKGIALYLGKDVVSEEDDKSCLPLYVVKQHWDGKGIIAGGSIKDASYTFQNGYVVNVTLDTVGGRKMGRFSGDNIGKRLAIVLDDIVISAPAIQVEITANFNITGKFSEEEAENLAIFLKSGKMLAKLDIVEEVIIGPTLGQEATNQGLWSIIVGLLLIILFMLIYYASGGMVANFALGINMLFILGILAQVGAALTLPGIAGIVLTIGMTVDANVLIFERIREELKKGVYQGLAISRGYSKAYSSIIDANVTTLLTGVVLYLLGQGAIKGFATTLIIGIMTSVFTAVLVSRIVIELIGKLLGYEALNFSFAFTDALIPKFNINFYGLRKWSYLFSLIFIGIGGFLTYQQGGLNWGVDFTGGRSYIVQFSKKVEPTGLKEALGESLGNSSVEVKTYGNTETLKVTTSYGMNERSARADERVHGLMEEYIAAYTGMKAVPPTVKLKEATFTIASSAKMGASVAEDVKWSSLMALLLALLVIFAYILLRFRRWQYGLGAIVALVHDSLAVFAAFGIARYLGYAYEIDQVFIAAILSVLGYSINDTVVVIDRIRERELLQFDKKDMVRLINGAINDTMSRTLITSITTFMAVCSLFVLGGEALRSFSLAMLVGILFGTFSSIYIATPLAIDFFGKKK